MIAFIMKKFINISVLFVLAIFLGSAWSANQPNIVVILVDDLGNADLGYRGGQVKTPVIDKLANQSLRLNAHYGMPLCTPGRAALMTGRYPMRYGLQSFVIFPSHTYGLALDEVTMPQLLKKAGYATAMVGKWHLGHADEKYWPQQRGFDSFYGNLVGEVDYFTKRRGGIIDWQENGVFFADKTYYTQAIGKKAVELIEAHDTAKPLFLYVADLAPHTPYEVPEKYTKLYPHESNEIRKKYMAMVSAVDEQVGNITKALANKGMLENTLIFFSSDNGGMAKGFVHASGGARTQVDKAKGQSLKSRPPADNGIYRAGKGSLYEGGVRVPAFIYWPNQIQPGVSNEPMHHVDILPTVIEAANIKNPVTKPLDGVSLLPILKGEKKHLDRNLLINVELFRGAVRQGKWKLIQVTLLPGKVELYDLEKDPGEKVNLAKKHPEKVKELQSLLMNYAKQQKPSLWFKVQPQFLKYQGKTRFDDKFKIDENGLPVLKHP